MPPLVGRSWPKTLSLFALLTAAQPGCRSAGPAADPAPAPAVSADLGPRSVAPEQAVLARYGEGEILGAELRAEVDMKRAVAQARGQDPPAESLLRDKGFRRSVVLDLIDRHLIRAEARLRGLEPSEDELEAELAENPGDGSERWTELLADRWRAHALARALLGPLDDAGLRRHYLRRNDRIEVRFAKLARTPTSKEIDRLLREEPHAVDEYYAAHPREFRAPLRRTVRYLSLAVPPGATEQERQALRARVDGLRSEVQQGRMTMLEAVRRNSDHSSRSHDGLVGPVLRAEMPAAFAVPVGEMSAVHSDLAGYYFVQVLEEQGGRARALDEGLRREVAARAVVGTKRNVAARALAEKVRAAFGGEGALAPLLQEAGSQLESSGLFGIGGGTRIPNLGLVPEGLLTSLFGRTAPAAPEPVQEIGSHLVVLQVVRHEAPDWERFDERKEQLRTEVLQWETRAALTRWLSQRRERNAVRLDYDALMAVPLAPEPGGSPDAGPQEPRP